MNFSNRARSNFTNLGHYLLVRKYTNMKCYKLCAILSLIAKLPSVHPKVVVSSDNNTA